MKHLTPIRLFVLLAGLVAVLGAPWLRTGPEALLSWDELGYYLYLPATFIYGDLRHLDFVPNLLLTYQPTGYFYQALRLDSGSWVMAYTLGVSLLQAPFFFLGHTAALALGYPADGLSAPYQAAIWGAGVFYSGVGVWALSRFLGEYVAPRVVLVVVALLLLGTNLLTYALLNNAMSHGYLFGLYAVLLRATQQWHARGRAVHLAAMAGALGLLIAIRPSEAVAVLLPVLWNLQPAAARHEKFQLVRAQWGRILVIGGCGLLPWLLQMTYWHWATGHWLFNYYQHMGLGFDWTAPHVADVLFSARKGWLLYTPAAGLLLLGLGWLRGPKAEAVRWPLLAVFLLSFYVTSSWSVWWYGGSLGQRALVPLYAVLALPLALLTDWLRPRPAVAYVGGVLASVCIAVNLSFAWQYYVGNMLTDSTEIRQYKEYLINPVGDYIPTGRRAAAHRWHEAAIAGHVPLRADSLRADHQPGLRMGAGGSEFGSNQIISAQELIDNKVQWLRFYLEAAVLYHDPTTVNGLRVVLEVRTQAGLLRKWAAVAAGEQVAGKGKGGAGRWQPIEQDIALPSTMKYSDGTKIYLWCSGPDSTLVRNFRVEGLRLK